jgi:geranylgeranyl pyrophosphate synthase
MKRITPKFNELIHSDLELVYSRMRETYALADPTIKAILNRFVSPGGKQIRPAIILLTGRMLDGPDDRIISFATAVEMLHTATLVHDDLIDSAQFRRGNPTINSQWSPDVAVLIGDFIFARAAHLAVDTGSLDVMELFTRTLTIIAHGEIAQLLGNQHGDMHESYYQRIYAKTASLFETSSFCSAILSPCSKTCQAAMKRYGYQIGMAFQIIDDVLDFVGNPAEIGKPVGSDLRNRIITLPFILYMEDHRDDPLLQLILNHETIDEEDLNKLIKAIQVSDAIKRSIQKANEFSQAGIEQLASMPNTVERSALIEIAHYIVDLRI